MENRRDGIETRRRIIAAACEVFAEKGYRGATNAEICRRSGANGAAINYHFRSKEALYLASFKLTLEESLKAHPFDKGEGNPRSAVDKFRDMVRSVIKRITDPANKSFAILHKEMSEPTGLLDGIMGEFIGTEMEEMKVLIAEILGPGANPRTIELCATSVISQCLHPALRERGRMEGRHPRPPGANANRPLDVDEMVRHVFEFSIAALNSFSARKENDDTRRSP
ncbi:MAG: hypothetical protein A2X49_17295 [Lentisphaerae bacterium GWF2_52_8]|nr:MAG: hypothetical protein A2X49_17295 [Lentisphaerae bacterium GWF2_52_8]